MQGLGYTQEELVLIEAVHVAPRDDWPRLEYAHRMGQNGAEDYSEFIRLQCQRPYIGIEGGRSPREGMSWDFPRDDETAKDRLQNLLDLLTKIYRTERFSSLAKLLFFEEFHRGLPLLYIDEGDWGFPKGVVRGNSFNLPPLARIDVQLYTYRSRLAQWLNHPLMSRVDNLRIRLHPAYEEPQEDEEDKDWDVEFLESDIRHLAAWPLLDQLETLNFCRPVSDLAEELAEELLSPRVTLDYSYG